MILIPLDQIIFGNKGSIRAESEIQKLAEDIKTNGLLNPIVVEKAGKRHYRIRDGHRRYLAFQLNQETEIPARIENGS